MLNWLIDFSLRHRFLVLLATLALVVVGGASMFYVNIDAFPDTTPVQIQINTTAPALGPEEIEQQITFPIEQALGGLPRLEKLHSLSKFGLSQVVVTFADGTDINFARQVVGQRLATVKLSAGIELPKMGPISTGLGEVFHYLVTAKGRDLSKLSEEERAQVMTELRTIHDWVIKPKLKTITGVAEINSWGGCEKQYQVRIDPDRLIKHGLTFDQVAEAVDKNNQNVGGGNIRRGSQALLVHGIGRTVNAEQIKGIVIVTYEGVPVRVGDVADVETGHEIRRGAVSADGKGEAVLGLGFMLMGENSHDVTWALKNKLEDIRQTLPPDVDIQTVYDRTELVAHVIDTVRKNLFEGGLLVVAVLFAFLGNLRAAFIVALAIPLSMLFAFSGMLQFGIAASLLSLGAVDFGMIVDSSVVMVENCVRHLAGNGERRDGNREPAAHPGWLATRDARLATIRDAAVEVRKPTLFGELIIMIVYLPILTLEGVEGKLFRPMALTVIFALAGSMILSVTLMPVLASIFLPRRLDEREPILMRLAHRIHNPLLKICMEHKLIVCVVTLCVLVVAFGMIAPHLGSEFVPRLSEGAIVVGISRLPGTDLEESIQYNTRMEQALLSAFPDEVAHVWSRVGTAEVATDPMGTELTDLYIALKPRELWKNKDLTQDELTRLIEKELRDLPGQRLGYMQPIEHRMNEMTSGVRSDLGIKLFGDDFTVLTAKAKEIERVIRTIDGSADVFVEQITGQPILQVKIRQDEIARYGVPARAVLNLIESVGSKPIGEVIEGQKRFPLTFRLPETHRGSVDKIKALLVATPAGERIPLERLADVEELEGQATIVREWGQRRITVTCNIRGRDLGSFVAEARRKVADEVQLPPDGRYHLAWGGQFENYERAVRRLCFVVPAAIFLVFALLYLTYDNVVDALRVFTGVPLGWVGGIFALWLRDMPFSISAVIGFIAMSGVAVLDDMILVSYIRQLRRKGVPRDEAVRQAAVTRLRPVLMTTLVASLGFVPMAFSTGMGAEVQRPLATVVIGGVISAMVMSLLVIRVLYVIFDSLADGALWILSRGFGLSREALVPVFGIHGEREAGERQSVSPT